MPEIDPHENSVWMVISIVCFLQTYPFTSNGCICWFIYGQNCLKPDVLRYKIGSNVKLETYGFGLSKRCLVSSSYSFHHIN